MIKAKKGDMSMGLIVAIVLGLIILVISAYIIYDKFKQGNAATSCAGQGGNCIKNDPGDSSIKCPDSLPTKSIIPCKTPDSADNKYDGICCLPGDF